ncbi:MAG: STAS domain-containing protein [Gammaproteobacteria bacterium]|nr:STAS domain-containing protein [Gammaproteobacteria bacterium]MDH5802333.1 STAS domain-containing protein [Gammaproteobacteria bacterium]
MIKVLKRGKNKQLEISGELTIYTANEFKTALLKHFKNLVSLELDLSKVSDLDTAGIQILRVAHKDLAKQGIQLNVVNHSAATLEAFKLYKLHGTQDWLA